MRGMRELSEPARLRGATAVIKIKGYLEDHTADALDQVFESLLESDCFDIILDLADVKYIGSRGWSVFLSKIMRLREHGGDLRLARMSPDVLAVFTVLEFYWFLRPYNTLAEAIAAVEEARADRLLAKPA